MKMKKGIIIVLLFIANCNINANDVNSNDERVGTTNTNLFSYGALVGNVSEINFMNLFKNFSSYIENADEIKLMYYHYVGVFKNTREIKCYVKKNFPPYVPSWGNEMNFGGNTKDGEFSSIRFTIEKDPFSKPDKEIINNLVNKYLHVGDEIWEVVFKLWDKEYHYYVFVDSKTHNVINYCNLFGVSIPQYHIDHINNLRKSSG